MISVQRVSKSFGSVRAVHDVSFEVGRGEVVGLLGANGAGKSTTIRMITGFLPPDAGRIAIEGSDTLEASLSARRRIGYLPESAPAYAEMTVQDYLDFRGRLAGLARGKRRTAMLEAMESCELADVAKRRVGNLSRGYRQRVGMAAAILHAPPVLVLDEPTSALDPRQIKHIRQLIRSLAAERAVLVSSHILPEVEQTCDRIVVMARGTVRLNARPRDLVARYAAEAPLSIQVRGDPKSAAEVIARVPGVTGVETRGNTLAVQGQSQAGTLEDAVSRALIAAGHGIVELRRLTPSLERIFLDLIESEEPGEKGRAA